MPNCPFCKKPIESYWSYCQYCNKPLIININDISSVNHSSFNEMDFHNGKGFYENFNGEKEENDEDLKEIDTRLSGLEKSGKNMGPLLLKKASLFYKKREYSSALNNLKLALHNFEEDKDQLNIAVCHNELGLINEELGYYDQAIYHFDISMNILETIADLQKLIQVLNNIGNIYFIINDLEQSYSYYQKALSLAEKEKLELEAVKSSSNLVEVLFLLKDYQRILKILKTNLEFFSNSHDFYGTALTFLKFGKVYYHFGEGYYDQANNYLIDTLTLINRIERKITPLTKARLEWECFLYLAKLNILWENDVEAENYLLKSLELIRTFEIQNHINEGLVLENLARFYSIKGEDNKAIDFFKLAIEIYEKYGNKIKIAEIQKEIAEIFKEFLQDFEKAKVFYEKALEIYETEHYYKESAEILNKLGEIYKEQKIIYLAIKSFKKAGRYYSEVKDEYNFTLLNQKIKSLTKDQDID